MPRITFAKGIEVYYRGMYGKIYFVCDKYITICIRKLDHRSKDVCLLVYPDNFKDVLLAKESTK